MANTNNRKSLLLFVIQILLTLIFCSEIIHMTTVLHEDNSANFIQTLSSYISQAVILISSMLPIIVLRLKRKVHSQDGQIFPLLFMMTSLQTVLIYPQYYRITRLLIMDPTIIIIGRFSLIGTAGVFLLSALRFYGFSSSRIGLLTTMMLGASFIISYLAPVNTTDSLYVMSSPYDDYLWLVITLLYTATIITMLITMIKDRTPTNTKRLVAFVFLITGINLASSPNMIANIIACSFYIVGIVVLISSTKESF